jgi:hypothetical protein
MVTPVPLGRAQTWLGRREGMGAVRELTLMVSSGASEGLSFWLPWGGERWGDKQSNSR